MAKGNTALLDAVNGALKELIEDGTDPDHHRQVHSRCAGSRVGITCDGSEKGGILPPFFCHIRNP